MKKISILVPTYNEEENVVPLSKAIVHELETSLPEYDYELLFIDNDSSDNTRPLLREICRQNPKIKAIFNAKNFGQFNSPYYGMCQTTGDCTICMCADFQDPVEMIPKLVQEWENGYMIVSAIKTSSKENPVMRFLRTCYYKLIKKMSDVEQIEHFTGFGLYDKSFIRVLKSLNDPTPFLRGIVAELGYKRKSLPYEQQKRAAGKTHNNWASLYDAAMLSFTSYTKIGLRIATIIYWQTQDKKFLKKINRVLADIDRNGYECTGKPEPLKGNLTGYWSVRIDDKNRIVFRITDGNLEIIQCGSHYGDK